MKLRRFIMIAIIILPILAIIVSANKYSFNEKQYADTVREVTKNTKLADINLHHNQALDVMEYAKNLKIESPDVLINFDTHSDITLNYPIADLPMAGIESWITEIIAKNPSIKEVYWVMPDVEADHCKLRLLASENDYENLEDNTPTILFGNSMQNDIEILHFIKNPISKTPYTQEFLINTTTEKINEIPRDDAIYTKVFESDKNLRKVKVTTCTLNTLPDLLGKKVFLSIDADYTSNSGFDTFENFRFIKSKKEIAYLFDKIFKTLKDKNVDVRIMSLTISPHYLPMHLHAYLEEKFTEILILSNKIDVIETYKRKYNPENNYKIKKA